MRESTDGLFHGVSPKTVSWPEEGRTWPVMTLISVLLPAPFGPTMPVMPAPRVKETLLSPRITP
jgi:hypothetical protein